MVLFSAWLFLFYTEDKQSDNSTEKTCLANACNDTYRNQYNYLTYSTWIKCHSVEFVQIRGGSSCTSSSISLINSPFLFYEDLQNLQPFAHLDTRLFKHEGPNTKTHNKSFELVNLRIAYLSCLSSHKRLDFIFIITKKPVTV